MYNSLPAQSIASRGLYPEREEPRLGKVEQWAEFRTMEDAQKRYREAQEVYSKVANELGVAIK